MSSSVENYNILDHFHLNDELLAFYGSLKSQGIRVIMYTSETIQDDPNLQPALSKVFSKEDIFSAQKLGIDKKAAEGYQVLLTKLDKRVEEALFVDDADANVQAAKGAGIKTIQFENNEQAIAELQSLISIRK